MPTYHKSKGHKFYKNSEHVYIYNVSKSLIRQCGNDVSVGFKYPQSEDGYAHFTVNKDNVFDSENNNFKHIIMPDNKKIPLTYKENGMNVTHEVTPFDIKASFEKTRVSSKPSRKYQPQAVTSLEAERSEINHSNDYEMENPFD